MDKEEFRIKLEEINVLVANRDYKSAMKIVDTVDWRRVKNVRTLCTVGEIYAANKRYEDSKEIFLLAYHRAPIGKTILYRLIEVSLKMGDVKEAIEFFDEYKSVAPNDNTRFVLKYKILKSKRNSLNEQIAALEEYKSREFTEKWSYELAKLYYKAGEKQKCLSLCDEMILWFREGTYVVKAMDLKMRLGALSGVEKEQYEQQFIPKLKTAEELSAEREQNNKAEKVPSLEPEEPRIESIRIRGEKDLRGAETLQDKISKGLKDIFGGIRRNSEELFEEEESEADFSDKVIRKRANREEFEEDSYENVPDLEEDAGVTVRKAEKIQSLEREPVDMGTIRMPELKIPDSMKNMGLRETLKAPDLSVPRRLYDEEEKADETELLNEPAEEKVKEAPVEEFSFNLEDTILAAATAQGIIPAEKPDTPAKKAVRIVEEEEEEEEEEEAEEAEVVSKAEEPEEAIQEELQEEIEEEILTEADLQEAEDEFFHGPKKTPAAAKKPEIPDLEMEDIVGKPLSGDALFKGNAESDIDLDGLSQELLNRILKDEMEASDPDIFVKEKTVVEKLEEASEAIEQEELVEEEPVSEEIEEEAEEELTEEEKIERFIESIQPEEEEKDPYELVLREQELTEEEKKLFTYFVKVPSVKSQLIEVLCEAQKSATDKTSKTGNIIVMGSKETGKTRLISSLIPAICKELNMEAAKVAYVFADQINGKDMFEIVEKLSGGFLVIEGVNQLNVETAEQLDKALEADTNGLTVIIEDEKIGMRKMLARYPKLAKKFTSMINIPVFTNDELVNFAKVYTKENGYKIEQMGLLALYNLIGVNQKEDEPMSVGKVKALVDSAIAKSQGGIRKFKKKRADRDGYTLLFEKDFSNK